MTTAARADWGRSASSEFRNSNRITTTPAPTTPVSWDLAPDCSATAVRDPLVEMANPWNAPAAMLATPIPIISWSGCTSSPRRAAKLDAVAMVSVSDTRVIPAAATSNGPTSPSFVHGSDGRGTPWGRAPTVLTPCWSSTRTAETTVAPMTATSTAGTRRLMRGQEEQDGEHAESHRERRPVGLVEVLEEGTHLAHEAVGVGGEPEELGELTDHDGDGQPVHVADLHLAREQVGHEPQPTDAHRHLDQPDEHGQHPRQRDRPTRIVAGHQQRRQGREDEG